MNEQKTNKVSRYVVGFMFDQSMEEVALIRKNKPEWQAGLLNGVGGKIEPNESALFAMRREFLEEAGSETDGMWNPFCSMSGKNNDGERFEIEFFYAIGALAVLKSQESEKLEIHRSYRICGGAEKTIGNLPWLIAAALDFGRGVHPPFKIIAYY